MADILAPVIRTDGSPAPSGATIVDAFSRQVKELFFIDNHAYIGTDKAAAYASTDFASYAHSKEASAVNVYYPWLNTDVRTVGADDYFRLITNRNQDLITAAEQRKLYGTRIAVFGLSVGSNIAFTLAQAGIGRRMTIADFDELDTTNLNRILAGVHQVGLNKTTVAARHIYENNPFAQLRTLPNGADEKTVRSLLEQRELDIIVDEVDNMPFKVSLRKAAMAAKIPVVMVTDNGDGVVLHVERYDLGLRTIFGKEPAYFDAHAQGEMSREQAGRMIMEDIVGGMHRVDPLMLASVQRVLAKELVSWSQLGSAALLGGVVATYMLKQIVLGKNQQQDIRAYIAPSSGEWSSHV